MRANTSRSPFNAELLFAAVEHKKYLELGQRGIVVETKRSKGCL